MSEIIKKFHILKRSDAVRIGKFGFVGVLGVGVNMGLYFIFSDILGITDFISRALAIEVSIIHNFAWNFSWTWKDRSGSIREIPSRMLRYHGSTLFSSFGVTLATGWLLMLILPETVIARYMSHLAGIGVGMVSNYILSDLWVFKKSQGGEDND
ncbi:MAG: GtrA family protein [Candidatus Electryonea clarkiae]|nr:GtrA family protein [Candidatus Electryonea clarkiae]MDP8287082.1 GtrA family protein [Candidatus Electryonea clarkiae]